MTSFGGPIAHLGYFREALVVKRRWLDEAEYAELVALAQFLPGPASSQVGIGIGLMQAGVPGALAAWTGFTLPSAVLLTLFGYGVVAFPDAVSTGGLHGLKIAAVAVVAQAILGMGRLLCPDPPRMMLALFAAGLVVGIPSGWAPFAAMLVGAWVGRWVLPVGTLADGGDPGTRSSRANGGRLEVPVSRGVALTALGIWGALLFALPVATAVSASPSLAVTDTFFRAGSLVFGGGHVVLPLLEAEVVAPGWISQEAFLAGYGAAQAIPGPLFTFAAYLGAVMQTAPNGWVGALLCLCAIFAPSFLLVIGVLPFWRRLRKVSGLRRALAGVNAAVVGLLLAAFYDPVWTSAVRSPQDVVLALAAFLSLVFWRAPPWLLVAVLAVVGVVLPA